MVATLNDNDESQNEERKKIDNSYYMAVNDLMDEDLLESNMQIDNSQCLDVGCLSHSIIIKEKVMDVKGKCSNSISENDHHGKVQVLEEVTSIDITLLPTKENQQ
ncbi:Uncharacterized protein TCM_018348 [Theobroma cacao]|uniref:Uncharacterized protein n=1 Tax=Theobroma cacao TaxID=3641 RepID=A0A061EEE4_THECC|nr:Uncharacterized protein TCM_018348 [Theobroma cacao]